MKQCMFNPDKEKESVVAPSIKVEEGDDGDYILKLHACGPLTSYRIR